MNAFLQPNFTKDPFKTDATFYIKKFSFVFCKKVANMKTVTQQIFPFFRFKDSTK